MFSFEQNAKNADIAQRAAIAKGAEAARNANVPRFGGRLGLVSSADEQKIDECLESITTTYSEAYSSLVAGFAESEALREMVKAN